MVKAPPAAKVRPAPKLEPKPPLHPPPERLLQEQQKLRLPPGDWRTATPPTTCEGAAAIEEIGKKAWAENITSSQTPTRSEEKCNTQEIKEKAVQHQKEEKGKEGGQSAASSSHEILKAAQNHLSEELRMEMEDLDHQEFIIRATVLKLQDKWREVKKRKAKVTEEAKTCCVTPQPKKGARATSNGHGHGTGDPDTTAEPEHT